MELGTLHRDQQRSDDAIQTRLMQRLRPDTLTRPVPAHALAYAHPRLQSYVLRPDEDMFSIQRLAQSEPRKIFFSPLLPVPLVQAKVKYLAAGQTLRIMTEHADFQTCATTCTGKAFHPGELWVGVQTTAPVPASQPLCFFVNWPLEDERRKKGCYAKLPLVQWLSGNRPLATKTGLFFDQSVAGHGDKNFVDEEFMHSYGLEKTVLQQYTDRFVTVQASGMPATPAPAEVVDKFQEDTSLEMFKEDLLWFRLLFPAGYRPEEICGTTLQLNCFPVINRYLDRSRDFMPSGNTGTEIIALSNADKGRAALSDLGAYFLGIQRIFTRNTDYRPVAFDTFRNAPAGYYALQRGRVEASDFRDLYARISELSQVLHSHASTLMLLPQHSLNQALSSIESGALALESALQQIPPKDIDLGYYLHFKVLDPQEMLYVRFWLTQGEYAWGVGSVGSLLQSERGGVVEGDMGWVVE